MHDLHVFFNSTESFFFNLKVFIKGTPQQEEQETMRSKDTEFAAVKLPRCLVCGGVKVEWGRH